MTLLTSDQKKYIRKVYLYKNDIEIARELGVSPYTIKSFRGKEKLRRKKSQKAPNNPSEMRQYKLDLYKRKYIEAFKNSKQYAILCESYTDDEIDYYLEEFIVHLYEVEEQGSILTSSEKRALDQLIQTQIAINRFAKREKDVQEAIKKEQNGNNDSQILAALMSNLEFVSKELRNLRDTFIDLQKSLELTRQERSKKKSDAKINVLTLLEEIKDEKTKLGLAYWIGLSEKAMMSVLRRWRKDSVLLDEVPKREIRTTKIGKDLEDDENYGY